MRIGGLGCAVVAVLVGAVAWASPARSAPPGDPCEPAAIGDGRTDNTAALQAAIDACSADGGGLVTLSGGVFVTGPILLRDHVLLNVEAGATLQGTADPTRYEGAFIGFPYRPREALISAYGARDVGVIGQGTIDGQGAPWWAASGLPRPWLIEFYRTRSAVVEGVTIRDAPMWGIVARYSTSVFINEVSIRNPADSPGTDGIDVVSSHNVRISRASIDTGGDCIALKSGLPGLAVPPVPTGNVRIADSTLGAGLGLSIGSEAGGGISHVQVRNVAFHGTQSGIRISTGRDRGNEISDLSYRNITMTGVGTPISFSADDPGADAAQPITATTPFIHGILIDTFDATGAASAGLIAGLPESPIYNLALRNVSIVAQTGLALRDVSLRTERLTITVQHGDPLIEQDGVHLVGN
ncbi:MAG: glycoside hydrolase [Acidisphaera sp.]|nr:glycoside hydrolase [Acidisphaera sp.]